MLNRRSLDVPTGFSIPVVILIFGLMLRDALICPYTGPGGLLEPIAYLCFSNLGGMSVTTLAILLYVHFSNQYIRPDLIDRCSSKLRVSRVRFILVSGGIIWLIGTVTFFLLFWLRR